MFMRDRRRTLFSASRCLLGLTLGLALIQPGCSTKKASSTDDAAASTEGETKATGEVIVLTGTIATGSSALNLSADESGTMKCTYAKEAETSVDVDADGKFSASCKSGIPMVMSYFDSTGVPTCSIIFKAAQKDISTATLNQDIDFKTITCKDGEGSVDLDVLAPKVASAQDFTRDTSVTLINGETDHWEFTVEKIAQIGIDGKADSGKSKKESKSRKKSAALTDGGKDDKGGGGDQVGSVISLAFSDKNCADEALEDGMISVLHAEPNQESEEVEWECIDGASVVWSGTSFTIKLKEEMDVAEEMAKNEIRNQRPQVQQVDFATVGEDGKVQEVDRDRGISEVNPPALQLAEEEEEKFGAPDDIEEGMNFPVEFYCSNTKWKTYLDTTEFGTPCTNLEKQQSGEFVFIDFGKICKELEDTATEGTLAKSNVAQCGGQGGSGGGNRGPKPSEANANDPQCAEGFEQFQGGSPVDGMSAGVADMRDRLALIVKLSDLAEAGDEDLQPAKAALAAAVKKLTESFAKVSKKMSVMESAVAKIEANRIARCASTTPTQRDPKEEQKLFAQMDGRDLQPLFNNFQQIYDNAVNRDPVIRNAFSRYIMVPAVGFDRTACVIPEGAETVYDAGFLKPTGSCKLTKNITVTGTFSDAETIKAMAIQFMDAPAGPCELGVQRISFDAETGCWEWDGTKPKLTSESVDPAAMFGGGMIQRMKLIGSSVLKED